MASDADIVRKLYPAVTASVKARNPHIYGAGAVAGRLRPGQPERGPECWGEDKVMEGHPVKVEHCVEIITYRRRLLDGHDNFRILHKQLCDCITAYLGYASDDHPDLTWDFKQFKTSGKQGAIVKIERIVTPLRAAQPSKAHQPAPPP